MAEGETEEDLASLYESLGVTPYEHGEPTTPIPLPPDPSYEERMKREEASFIDELPEGFGKVYKQAEEKALDNSIAMGETEEVMNELYEMLEVYSFEQKVDMEKEKFLEDMPDAFAKLYEESENMAEKNKIAKLEAEKELESICERLAA